MMEESIDLGHPSDPGPLKHFTRRRLRTVNPPNQDLTFLVLTEYDWDEDENGNLVGEAVNKVLTEDGWYVFAPWEILPPNMPHINGIDQVHQSTIDDRLKDFTQVLNNLLSEFNVEGITTQPAEVPTERQGNG